MMNENEPKPEIVKGKGHFDLHEWA